MPQKIYSYVLIYFFTSVEYSSHSSSTLLYVLVHTEWEQHYSSSQCSLIVQWGTIQQMTLPGTSSFAQEEGCACAALVLKSVSKKEAISLLALRILQGQKEAETHIWVTKCGISQQIDDRPQKMLSECV